VGDSRRARRPRPSARPQVCALLACIGMDTAQPQLPVARTADL